MPQFIEIDLAQKRLNTTKASGLNGASVAAPSRGVTAFGVCTPLPSTRWKGAMS